MSAQRVQAQLHAQQKQLSERTYALRRAATAKLAGLRSTLAQQPPRLYRVLDVQARPAGARVETLKARLVTAVRTLLSRQQEALTRASAQLSPRRVTARCERERETLAASERILRAHDPRRALERGFSLTYTESGSLVRSIHELRAGQTITTHLADGQVESQVESASEDTDERH
jgi:exodeoxyribonuclease VII large subunit